MFKFCALEWAANTITAPINRPVFIANKKDENPAQKKPTQPNFPIF